MFVLPSDHHGLGFDKDYRCFSGEDSTLQVTENTKGDNLIIRNPDGREIEFTFERVERDRENEVTAWIWKAIMGHRFPLTFRVFND
jgi:hypothetical protein